MPRWPSGAVQSLLNRFQQDRQHWQRPVPLRNARRLVPLTISNLERRSTAKAAEDRPRRQPSGDHELEAPIVVRHGQGTEIREVPMHLVAYVLHLTAAAIVFLVEAEENLS